ncbi:MAG: DUF3565 domain-containing protein [Hyphomicrobiaceae bacterium]
MERTIIGFRQDDEGYWIAEFDCGHSQHVRHKPPFIERPWVVSDDERRAYIGRRMTCGQCANELVPSSRSAGESNS